MNQAAAVVVERTPQVIAAEINSIKNQTRVIMLQASIEIGRRLTEAKALVAHGEWGGWLEKSVDYSKSTANNLMRIYEEYGDKQISFFGGSNLQALGDLNYTQAVALLGIPADEREQFVEEHDLGSMSTRELQQAIKERDAAVKERDKARQAVSGLDSKYTATAEQLRESREAEKRLQEALDQERKRAKETGESDERAKQLEAQLKEAQQKVKHLEEEARKPITVEPAIVEKVPVEVERELGELRAKQQQSEAVLKFRVHFDGLVGGFQALLTTLAEIRETSAEDYEKYRGAVSGLIGKMQERL